jgi:hypothetical protein
MSTLYTHRVTIAVPESLINQANHLSCIMGESSADINTFTTASYEDVDGNLYAVCSTVVTETFLAKQTSGITIIPEHASDADPVLAQEAFESLNQAGGMMMIINPDAQAALAEMGLVAVSQEEYEEDMTIPENTTIQ